MKVLAIAIFVVASVYGLPADNMMPTGDSTMPPGTLDPFIVLVKEIEKSAFFPTLDSQNKLLTFEMLAAAETRNLELLLNRLGYVVLLEYLDALPQDYQHRFVRYSVEHLQLEDVSKVSS